MNCVGVMGKGVAAPFKEKFPAMFEAYKKQCRSGTLRPGMILPYHDLSGVLILNFAVKDHWRNPSSHDWDEACLQRFAVHHARLGVTHVAFPALGALNGWLAWPPTLALMRHYLEPLPVDCELVFYRPRRERAALQNRAGWSLEARTRLLYYQHRDVFAGVIFESVAVTPFGVTPLDTVKALAAESAALGHCVGTNSHPSLHVAGRWRAFSLRRGTGSVATLLLAWDGKWSLKDGNQAKHLPLSEAQRTLGQRLTEHLDRVHPEPFADLLAPYRSPDEADCLDEEPLPF